MDTPDELLAPFIEAVSVTLREMATVESGALGTARTTGPDWAGDVTAVLPLAAAAGEGYLALCFPRSTIAALAVRVLCEAGVEPDDTMIRDCAGEVANVTAGQAKALLLGTPQHFTLGTPRVVADGDGAPGGDRCVAAFGSEVGEFTLHVFLPGWSTAP